MQIVIKLVLSVGVLAVSGLIVARIWQNDVTLWRFSPMNLVRKKVDDVTAPFVVSRDVIYRNNQIIAQVVDAPIIDEHSGTITFPKLQNAVGLSFDDASLPFTFGKYSLQITHVQTITDVTPNGRELENVNCKILSQ